MLHQHIGRRKTELAAEAVAADDPAADAVRAPQQALRAPHVACSQRFAYCGARHAHAIRYYAGHRVSFKSAAACGLLQHGKIAAAPGAEAEIIPHQYPACREAAVQDAVYEILGRGFREFEIEPADMHALDAETRQQFEFLAQRCKAGRRFVRREKFARVRLERHHARRHSKLTRSIIQTHEHRLMADMHPIEITDGQRNRACSGNWQGAENTH